MDFSKLLSAIRGNKAADASAAPKDRPETEPVIPVEVSPTVAAADHPPPVRTSGSVVQSLLGQFTGGHREPPPPAPPKTPPQGVANGYDDVLASVLPPGAAASSPATADTARKTPPMDTAAPLDGDWFDVSLDEKSPAATAAVDVPVLDLPLDVPATSVAPANVLTDTLLTAPAVAPAVDPFEVSGKVDLSWTPTETPAEPSPVADFPSRNDITDTGLPPPPVLPMAAPPDTIQPAEAFLAESATGSPAESTYVPPPPMDFAPAVGGFSHGMPMEAPLAPVNDWGFPPADTPAMPPASGAAPVSAVGMAEPAAASVPATGTASWSDWLIENLDEALMVLDAQGTLQQMNPMAEYLLGAPRQELLGRSLLEASQQLGGDNAPLWEHLSVTSEAQQFSTNVMLPDGQSMMASFVVLELPAHDLWPGGRVIAIRDETRLRAEFAQMMEDLTPPPAPTSALQVTPEQLTAMRTSLQMVLGFAELLHRGEYGQMNPQQFEMFRNIEHHAKQLAEWLGLPQ